LILQRDKNIIFFKTIFTVIITIIITVVVLLYQIRFQMRDPVTESDKPADGLRLWTVELSTARYEDFHYTTARRTPAV